ncbi:Small subunit (SSU) processome component [Pichia californica]|nr:Small subunit (SSU) processome component [[Candida] californica]
MSNSLIASEFSGVPVTGIAFTNISLNKPVLKYQPLNNTSSQSVSPLALDSSSQPSTILWLDEVYFLVLYNNKPFFELMNSNDISRIDQHINLVISSNPASCSSATYDKSNNILYLMDTSNRLYTYNFDSFADLKLEESSNYVIVELNESISKISISPLDNNKLLLMSNTLYEFDLQSQQIERSINLFVEKTNCYQIIDSSILISSQNDRFINLIDLLQFKVQTIFVSNSSIIKFELIKYKNKSILAAIDEDGFVEIFKDALNIQNLNGNESEKLTLNSKRRRRNGNKLVTSIQSVCILKLFNDLNGVKSFNKIDNIIFDHDQITIAYLQNENYFILDNFNWFSNKFDQPEILIQRKKQSIDRLKIRNDDKASLNIYKEDNQVTIRTGENFIDLDPIVQEEEKVNGEKEIDDEDDEDNGDDFNTLVSRLEKTTENKINNKKKESNKFQFKVGTLTTNLSQALRNNDTSMFDTIINNTTDENIVRSTISQLEQNFILKILDKLSELLYKNKFKNTNEAAEFGMGNASISLTTWIRYVLIYHGTYLISAANGNGELRRRLGLLGMSLEIRSGNMNRLLELKGRLAMVSMKVAVTRELENLDTNGEADFDEEDVEYIEEEEEEEEEED